MAGLYVHIPFCISKCRYCNFYSVGGFTAVPQPYVDALIADAVLHSPDWKTVVFDSVYFGGGTPSLLSVDQLSRILNVLREKYRIADYAEITLECNPATLGGKSLSQMRKLGVNRLSVGVQSLDSRDLLLLGRKHTPMDSLKLLHEAAEAGFENLSADLIIGIPEQSQESFEWTITRLSHLVDHISAYILSIEVGTELRRMVVEGRIVEPSEHRLVFLYNLASRLLGERGFERYEISNWCRSGRRSKHNLNYWLRGEYLGVGAGAHSHRNGRRFAEVADWRCYIDKILSGGDATEFTETLTEEEKITEEVGLRLRISDGLDLAFVAERLKRSNLCNLSDFLAKIDWLCKSGYLISKEGRISVSSKGAVLENEIVSYLLV